MTAARTPRQNALLAFVRDHTRDKGYPPTVREIGVACGIPSSSNVLYHLGRLAEQGMLRRTPGISRSIVLTNGEQNG